MKLLYSRAFAREKLKKVKEDIAKLPIKPGLGIVLIGNNPASILYVSLKTREAKKLGVYVKNSKLPEDGSFEKAAAAIQNLNDDPFIHGILLQLPLPSHLVTSSLITLIRPEKDVDGFLPSSFVLSPTVHAIKDVLRMIPFSLKGFRGCLLVKSEVFRKKITKMAKEEGIDVVDSADEADIIIIAKGEPNSLAASMIKEGVIIIDAGITVAHGRTIGDAAPDVAQKASYITPVPGGIGPLTVAHLFENLVVLVKRVL